MVPAATLLPAVAVQVAPAVEAVAQLMIAEPAVHVLVLVEGVTLISTQVVLAPL